MPHDTHLKQVLDLVAGLVQRPDACCAIVDDTGPDESSILGTRDGYLNLAYRLLEFVYRSDSGEIRAEEGVTWDDEIKSALYQLPVMDAVWIVGCYLYPDHASLMQHIESLLGNQLESPLSNDPDFHEPPLGAA